jgi:hypothetical protein
MAMETGILKTIRTQLGILPDFKDFDPELLVAINSALMAVSQLGIGPDGGFSISDDTADWADLFDGVSNIEAVKSYIFMKCKLEFDPPGTSFLIAAYERQLSELAFRLMIEVDPDLVPAE